MEGRGFEEQPGADLRAAPVEQIAPPPDATVPILGETGTGKELIARAIHDRSPRRGRALVRRPQ